MKNLKKIVLLIMLSVMVMVSSLAAQAAVRVNGGKGAVITVGKTKTLKISGTTKKPTWSSSNKAVATVSTKGTVKGIKQGKCVITAKIGKKAYKCNVTVKPNVFISENQNPSTWTIRAKVVTFNILKAYYKGGDFVCEGFWQNPTSISYTKLVTTVKVYAGTGSDRKLIASDDFVSTFGDLQELKPNHWIKHKLVFASSIVRRKKIDLRKCDLYVTTKVL